MYFTKSFLVLTIGLASLVPREENGTMHAFPHQATRIAVQASDTIVRIANSPVHSGLASLVLENTIGVVGGAKEYEFAEIADVLPARDGSVWVIDGGVLATTRATIRRYDRNGKFISTVGRNGRGPGEYGAPVNLAQFPDGRVAVWENWAKRIHIYAEDGSPVTSFAVPNLPGASGPGAFVTGIAGDIFVKALTVLPLTVNESAQTPPPFEGVVRFSGGRIADSIEVPGGRKRVLGANDIVVVAIGRNGARTRSLFRTPYAPRPFAVWSPLGYWISTRADTYSLELHIPGLRTSAAVRSASVLAAPPGTHWKPGEPVLSIRRNEAAPLISAEEKRDQANHVAALIKVSGGEVQGTVQPVPSRKPSIIDIRPTIDGRIWVQVSTPSERYNPPARASRQGISIPVIAWREPTTYDVFETNGAYVGRVPVPFDTQLRAMSGDTVWATTRDADGVEFVRRYRVSWR